MRVLILGGSGMLGHKLWQHARGRVDAFVTLRRARRDTPAPALWDAITGVERRLVEHVDAREPARVAAVLDEVRPDVVINCIGVVKAYVDRLDPAVVVQVNETFPHQLAALTIARGMRLVHISTDCVFRGDRGSYREDDPPDADDLYGKTKARGEPAGPGVLTLRTSMVGRELAGSAGLLEWFLAQAPESRQRSGPESGQTSGQTSGLGPVPGFRQARFSGLSTPVLAVLLIDLALRRPALEGLYHVAADPIDKYTLIGLFARAFRRVCTIDAMDDPRIDRTLDGSAFRAAAGFVAPPWPAMVADLAADPTPYISWRSPA